jgi:CO/xanthine dehydrogenase FAD-binding subunit
MAIAHEFEYQKPTTLDEAIEILAKHGPKARILAGGTDLVGWIRDDLVAPNVLIDIKGIAGLEEIDVQGGVLFIGALVTFAELMNSGIIREKAPLILEMARTVGSPGLRNRATMVGNICSAVPSCDSGPVLLIYDAEVLVKGPQGERKIPLGEWFRGPQKTAIRRGEVARGLMLPLPEKKHAGSYVKLGRYRGEDLAQAGVAVLALAGDGYRIAFGAVAPTPVRAKRIEALLDGNKLDDSGIAAAQKLVPQEISPITDIRGSREYRAHMIEVMLERGLKAATKRLSGQGPPYGASLI